MAIVLWILGIAVAALGLYGAGELMHSTHSGVFLLWQGALTRGPFVGDIAAFVGGILIIAFGTVLEQLHDIRKATRKMSAMLEHVAVQTTRIAPPVAVPVPPPTPIPPVLPPVVPGPLPGGP